MFKVFRTTRHKANVQPVLAIMVIRYIPQGKLFMCSSSGNKNVHLEKWIQGLNKVIEVKH